MAWRPRWGWVRCPLCADGWMHPPPASQERLVTMSEGAMPEVMQQRYAQLQEYQEAAAAELGRLQKRNQIYTSRIETLEAELERAKLAHEEEVETYKVRSWLWRGGGGGVACGAC